MSDTGLKVVPRRSPERDLADEGRGDQAEEIQAEEIK